MKPFELEIALALHRVLDAGGAGVGGMTLPELMRRWGATGLRRRDLGEALRRGEQSGDFAVTRDGGVLRVHVGHFDRRCLEPETPQEHRRLEDARARLEGLRRRRRAGPAAGRRARDRRAAPKRPPA